MKLIEAVEESEQTENGNGGGCVGPASLPELAPAHAIEPESQEDEEHSREQIQSRGDAGKKVESERAGSDDESAGAAGAQPFKFERESGESQQTDVVVLHHVLRVVQVRCGEEEGEHSGKGLLNAEGELPQEL